MNDKNDCFKESIIKEIKIIDIINLIFSALIIIIIIYEDFNIIYGTGNYFLVILNILIGLILISENIYSIYVKKRNIICNLKIENLEENNKNLLEVNDHIRCFKHDFNNIMQTLYACVDLGDIKTLRNYFKSLSKECNYMNSIDKLNINGKESPIIYSVLVNKYKLAENKNISMNIEILIDLSKFNRKSYTISRILGILLDNAIEASSECEEKIINIQILKENLENNKISIIIENTYKDKEIDTDKIFEKEYSTKREKGNSGLGLWKVKEMINKDYEIDLVTKKTSDMFIQKIEFYDSKDINFILK